MSEGLDGLLEQLVVRFKDPNSEWGQHYDEENGKVEWFVDMGEQVDTLDEANLVTSRRKESLTREARHALLLDFDFPVEIQDKTVFLSKIIDRTEHDNLKGALATAGIRYQPQQGIDPDQLIMPGPVYWVPSSSPGHYHIYMDVGLSDQTIEYVMVALMQAGLIQPGIVRGWRERGCLCLRKPGVVKGVETP